MNRIIFQLPPTSEFTTAGGLRVMRTTTHFSGGASLDALIERLDRHRGVMLSSGTTVPGRYESFDLGFSDSAFFSRCFRQQFDMTPLDWRRRTGCGHADGCQEDAGEEGRGNEDRGQDGAGEEGRRQEGSRPQDRRQEGARQAGRQEGDDGLIRDLRVGVGGQISSRRRPQLATVADCPAWTRCVTS